MADKKITALDLDTPVDTDLLPYVSDPGGTPVTKASTIADILALAGGSGDVVGPGSAADGHLAVFDGTSGKLLKDGGAPGGGGGGGGGGWTLLDLQAASNSASLVLTGISSAYDSYLIEILGLVPITNTANLQMQVSLDGGSTWETTNYNTIERYTGDNGAGSGTGLQPNNTPLVNLGSSVSSLSSGGVTGSLHLSNPLAATPAKLFRGGTGFYHSSAHFYHYELVIWYTGGALDALRFQFDSGNIASGSVRLYGLPNS